MSFYLFVILNRGIGRGIALSLARDGAKVVVNYQKDIKAAQAVVDAINSVKTGSAVAIQGDVSLSTDVDRLFTETKRIYGRIDIVVANSGKDAIDDNYLPNVKVQLTGEWMKTDVHRCIWGVTNRSYNK
jgi:NAD(P)-dependent dehydrogenase (short-subunit alcohol dehydrogenase family)